MSGPGDSPRPPAADGRDAPSEGSDPGRFHRRYQTPSVVIFDSSVRADLYSMWLADRHEVRTATSFSDAKEVIDDTTTVAVVRWELSDEVKKRIGAVLTDRSPWCKVLLTRSTRDIQLDLGMDYDIALQEPITEEGLKSAVDRLVARAKYSVAIQQYYKCTVEATNLEVKHSPEQLEQHRGYQRLRTHIESLQRLLDSLVAHFDIDDLDAVLSGIMSGGPAPEGGHESTVEQKYRPNNCPECGLEWGVDHGPPLGQGFEKLGAFVWDCERCGAIQNLPDPTNRHIARH